jgi:hypothetical protein
MASRFSQENPLAQEIIEIKTFGFHGKYKKFEKYMQLIN